ncbi:putative outer membrane efflux protein [Salinibacter ruber DSM 13855]|uniref:Outer membrane efflux protein n=5 Tax=Salinibacter ruber TaxID=146919 RepID=Q2S5B0_SALRD|nr:efflux transporter outer membrane subunit [Salinibacter ruber]ABC43874.1 putative outer membrane efflux protein [Salinibacter ruber DSM 13855]
MLTVAGCSMTPEMSTPEAEQDLPDRFEAAPGDTTLPAAAADTAAYDATRWWAAYEDPSLTALVDTALAANLNLEEAQGRVEELAAQFRIARAPLFPSVTANGQGNYQNQPANTGIGGAIGGGQGPDRFEFTDYQATLGLSYELDFWGRVRSQRTAALSQYFATAADLQTARLSVISQTISTYAQIASLRRQVRLGERTVGLLEERVAVTEDRYARGLVPSFQLYTVRQSLQAAQADQPDLERRLYEAQSRFATLLGRFAGEQRALLPDSMTVPLAPEPVPAGLPADLLMQRPDVRGAALRLEAARQEIGVARAEMLPSLSLTGQGGTQSSELADLVDPGQVFASFAGQLTAPLFQGGQLRANLNAAEARYKQQAARYEQTVLTAFQEVKASLVAYEKQRQRYREVERQVDTARDAFQAQRDRYERGVGDVLSLIDAERTLLQARTRLAGVRRAVTNARLALHRALGGPWTDAEPVDDPRLFR